jgi:hypothetical protein
MAIVLCLPKDKAEDVIVHEKATRLASGLQVKGLREQHGFVELAVNLSFKLVALEINCSKTSTKVTQSVSFKMLFGAAEKKLMRTHTLWDSLFCTNWFELVIYILFDQFLFIVLVYFMLFYRTYRKGSSYRNQHTTIGSGVCISGRDVVSHVGKFRFL